MSNFNWGPLASRYETKQPRKILALDGGGIRGLITLQILLKMETQLKEELEKKGKLAEPDKFRLAHYFDFIGGTSTGAIIAAGLSIGMSVSEIIDFYNEKGKTMFAPAGIFNKWRYFYKKEPLTNELKKTFGESDIDLQSGKFQTLLLAVTMNATTDSPWPITNNPGAKYNQPAHPECNLRIPLYKLIRASTAAPAYFPAEEIQLNPANPNKISKFVDGGVTPYNNPAFLMYRMATQKPFALNWETGERNLFIVSVGTGAAPTPKPYANLINTALQVPSNLMYAMQVDQDTNCRTVGRCVYGAPLDREIKDLIPLDSVGNVLPLESDASRHFQYVRYNADLSETALEKMRVNRAMWDKIRQLDAIDCMDYLTNIGEKTAAEQVNVAQHFVHFL